MSKINIQGREDVDDPFYRYQMHRPVIQKIKSHYVLLNLEIISKDLHRDSEHILKFLKKAWATSINYKNSILQTTKEIDEAIFIKSIRDYIDIYVLCELCKNPETNLVQGKHNLKKQCQACSHTSSIKI